MRDLKTVINELSDEEILNEFVKRFQCDGAILLYHDSSKEYGFGQWRNPAGRNWVDNAFNRLAPETNSNRRLRKKLKTSLVQQ